MSVASLLGGLQLVACVLSAKGLQEPPCAGGINLPCSVSAQHKYTSIAEVQVQMEEEYLRSPLSGVSAKGMLPSLESPHVAGRQIRKVALWGG